MNYARIVYGVNVNIVYGLNGLWFDYDMFYGLNYGLWFMERKGSHAIVDYVGHELNVWTSMILVEL